MIDAVAQRLTFAIGTFFAPSIKNRLNQEFAATANGRQRKTGVNWLMRQVTRGLIALSRLG
jgi:hypothetical protein